MHQLQVHPVASIATLQDETCELTVSGICFIRRIDAGIQVAQSMDCRVSDAVPLQSCERLEITRFYSVRMVVAAP